jgi:predicted nucleotidyltransferase
MTVTASGLRATLAERSRVAKAKAKAQRDRAVASVTESCVAFVREGAISGAWLVGSAAWGGFGERSDIDVVVGDLDERAAAGVVDALTEAAGVRVDLLRLEELSAGFRQRVLREGERLA